MSKDSLTTSDYWNDRYTEVTEDQQVHEWLRSFKDLEPFFTEYLFQVRAPETAPRILHLGSGDSTIPSDFSRLGYTKQICIDFASVVVQIMSKRHEHDPGIEWIQGDLRAMDMISSDSIDFAFDKSTMDAMIYGSPWNPPDDVVENTGRYMREVFRVLKPEGRLILVTYYQPHFVKPLLNCEGVDWDVKVVELGGSDSTFHYHGFVAEKR